MKLELTLQQAKLLKDWAEGKTVAASEDKDLYERIKEFINENDVLSFDLHQGDILIHKRTGIEVCLTWDAK